MLLVSGFQPVTPSSGPARPACWRGPPQSRPSWTDAWPARSGPGGWCLGHRGHMLWDKSRGKYQVGTKSVYRAHIRHILYYYYSFVIHFTQSSESPAATLISRWIKNTPVPEMRTATLVLLRGVPSLPWQPLFSSTPESPVAADPAFSRLLLRLRTTTASDPTSTHTTKHTHTHTQQNLQFSPTSTLDDSTVQLHSGVSVAHRAACGPASPRSRPPRRLAAAAGPSERPAGRPPARRPGRSWRCEPSRRRSGRPPCGATRTREGCSTETRLNQINEGRESDLGDSLFMFTFAQRSWMQMKETCT